MEIKLVTRDQLLYHTPILITARWLNKVLPLSIIERDENGTYNIIFPDMKREYLFGFFNQFEPQDALRTSNQETWNDELTSKTIWKHRTDAAQRIINELINLCEEHAKHYDDAIPKTLNLKLVERYI